jgi:DNA (cytosine-5)-methyltransferase 1
MTDSEIVKAKFRILDLFCGAGGFSEGFKQAGFKIVTVVDNNDQAIKSHKLNHPNAHHLNREIGKEGVLEEIIELGPYDVVIGSPPCPNFSISNTVSRDTFEGLRLVNEFIKIIQAIQPKYWIGENVPLAAKFIDIIFNTQGQVYNAYDYGTPQNRNRYFFGNFREPIATKNGRVMVDILEDVDEWKSYDNLSDSFRSRFEDEQQKKGFNYGRLLLPHKVPPTLTAHKDNAYSLIVKTGQTSSNGRMAKPIIEPTFTQTTTLGQIILNPTKYKYRHFTMTELRRVMGFPDDYQLYGNKSQQIKQLGNAVCPPMAKALGEAILNGNPTQSSLEAWL